MHRIVAVLSMPFLLCDAAEAQQAPSSPSLSSAELQILKRDPDAYIDRKIGELYRTSPDGVVSRADIEFRANEKIAQRRAGALTSYLAFDLDGDLEISAKEIAAQRGRYLGSRAAKFETIVVTMDANGDGAIDIGEIRDSVDKSMQRISVESLMAPSLKLLAFDANGDGSVEPAEVAAMVRTYAAMPGPEPRQPTLAVPGSAGNTLGLTGAERGCGFPRALPGDEVLFVSAIQGVALSTAAIGSPDFVTTVADLKIEPGETPLYVVAQNQDAVIWRVTGATQRVRRFVGVTARGPGVIGLEPGLVTFLRNSDCRMPSFTQAQAPVAWQARGNLVSRLRHEVSVVAGGARIGRMDLPSGREHSSFAAKVPSGGLVIEDRSLGLTYRPGDSAVQRRNPTTSGAVDLLGAWPGSELIQITPGGDLVSSGKVVPYDVLPREAGLRQLLDSGALTQLSSRSFAVEQPIPRFPAGLTGRGTASFVMRKGVPMPPGGPGLNTVTVEK